MTLEEAARSDRLDFTGIPSNYYLLGLLSAFDNRFQAMADQTMREISWKQFFAVICIRLCKTSPTLKELSDIMGSSHQNVKQLLIKLEKKGFIAFLPDEKDRRKQRIGLTQRCMEFCEKNDESTASVMDRMFAGIPPEDLSAAIRTITRIEKNMKEADR